MPINAKTLVESTFVSSALTTQYTVPVVATIIDKITVINCDTVANTINVYLVPAGQPTSNEHLIVKSKSLLPSETYTFPEIAGHILNTGDSIVTLGNVNDVMNFRVSGREIS